MLLHAIPNFRLQYDDALSLLRVSWTGDADLRTYRVGMLQLVGLADRLQVQLCLLEVDSVPDIPVYEQLWMSAHWVPEVIALTAMRQVVFTLDARRVYQQTVVESLLKLAQPFLRFDVQFFHHPAPAMRWLAEGAPQLPQLLAEWNDVALPPLPQVAKPAARYGR